MSEPIQDHLKQISIIDDIVYIEVARTRSDRNYGNWRLAIRVPCRSREIDETAEDLKKYIEDKTKDWVGDSAW